MQCCWATFATSVIVLLFSVTQSTCLCLSFLRYTSIFFCSYNIEPVKPIPTATGQEVVTSLSQGIAPLQNRKIRVNTFTPTANLENLFNSTSCLCMSLRGWLESLERTHTDKGRTCNLYAEKCQAGVYPGSTSCEETALTTAALYCQCSHCIGGTLKFICPIIHFTPLTRK